MSGSFLKVLLCIVHMEIWLDHEKLVEEEQWGRIIERLRSETGAFIERKELCVGKVENALVEAVKKRIPSEKCGMFLSGGVDSSLLVQIAYQMGADFTCYTVGFDKSIEAQDVQFARKVAEKVGVTWTLKLLSLEEIEKYVKRAVSILKKVQLVDSVSVGVAAVELAAIDLAKQDGITVFFGGLGAEEIFGGYKRHLDTNDVHNECWRGMKGMWNCDLVRDVAVASATGATFLTPFLDADLIKTAMRVPGKWKVHGGVRKVVLREVAEKMGVLKEVAWRKKSAAQYGSGFDNALGKLAKKAGLQKGEYLKGVI
jgi:diphthine-ammonia ligase